MLSPSFFGGEERAKAAMACGGKIWPRKAVFLRLWRVDGFVLLKDWTAEGKDGSDGLAGVDCFFSPTEGSEVTFAACTCSFCRRRTPREGGKKANLRFFMRITNN